MAPSEERLMPGPVRKENQLGLPDDFSNIDVTVLSRASHPASVFPRFFTTRPDGPLFGDLQNVLHNEGEARNFNISALRPCLQGGRVTLASGLP